MFFLLTGQDVHPSESANEMLVLAATKPARPLASVLPDLPLPLAAVVDKALFFQRDDRWPDARAMQTALQQAYIEIFGEPMPALPAVLDSAPAEGKSTSARSLRIKSMDSSSGARSSGAATQAVSSSPAVSVARREIAATAPPISAVAHGGGGSRRWLWVAAGALALTLAAGSAVVLRRAKSEVFVAAAVPVEPSAATSAPSTSQPTAPASVPAAAETATLAASAAPSSAPAPTGKASPPNVAHATSAAVPPPPNPGVRRKPRPTPAPRPNVPGPGENSAFEHQ